MARTELFVNKQSGGLFSVENMGYTTGSRFFVDSTTGTDSAGYGKSPDSPVATLDYAIGLCTASKGDVIYIMPGHTETWSAASPCTLDVANVKVIGLGTGTKRPTFTYTHVDATLSITAASCWVENCWFVANVDDTVCAITVGASADGLTLKNIILQDTATNKEFLVGISIAALCHYTTIDGLTVYGLGGGATGCIVYAGATYGTKIVNTFIDGTYSSNTIDLSAAAGYQLFLDNIYVFNHDTSAGLGIVMHASTEGFANNIQVCNLKNAVVGISGAAMAYGINVNYSNAVNASCRLAITADS